MAIWDQQQGESAQAHEAARLYFGLGADRSLEVVAQKLTKSTTIIKRWSTRWTWVERARAYDQHLADIEQERREQAVAAEADKWAARRAEQRDSDWALAQGLKVTAAKLIQQVDPERLKSIDPDTLTAGEAAKLIDTSARLVETAAKIARLAADMVTDRQQLDIAPIDWAHVPEEITAAFADGRIGLDDVLRHIRRGRGA